MKKVYYKIPRYYSIPFLILWLMFAFFWVYSSFNSGADIFFTLFGGIIILIGIVQIVYTIIYKKTLMPYFLPSGFDVEVENDVQKINDTEDKIQKNNIDELP